MKTRACFGLLGCALLTACAQYKNQLVFGESSDFSIAFHPLPEGGLSFNVGYKQTDIAVVPVATVDRSGKVLQRRAEGLSSEQETEKDAVSVFGQFSASSSRSPSDNSQTRNVTFGRFFATGVAAQRLAEGYAEGWTRGLTTKDSETAAGTALAAANAAQASANTAKKSADAAQASAKLATNFPSRLDDHVSKVASEAGKQAGEKAAYEVLANAGNSEPQSAVLPPLIFGQYDMLGLSLSGTPSNIDFALGYSGRNIAVMPLFGEGLKGFEALGSEGNQHKWQAKDAYSVLGQFKADTSTNAPDIGLDRFFATGVAAQKLSQGLQQRISAFISAQTNAELTKIGGAPKQ